jgi:hypothetical protein
MRLIFFLAAVAIAFAQEAPTRFVKWVPNTEWSDTIMYNGQRYKTIGVKDKILVGAALDNIHFATVALVMLTNEGQQRLEVDPSLFTCKCYGRRDKMLRQGWPFGADKNPNLKILRANAVFPGDDLAGMVGFEKGPCSNATLHVVISGVTFEFHFEWSGAQTYR